MIAQLMEAEQKASQIVSTARKNKIARQKEAKKEGRNIISQYEEEQKKKIEEQRKKLEKDINKEGIEARTQKSKKENQRGFDASSKICVQMLVESVLQCDAEACLATSNVIITQQ